MRTRDGNTVKLQDLLDEAKERAMVTFQERVEQNENVQISENEFAA